MEDVFKALAETLPPQLDLMTESSSYSEEEISAMQTKVILNFINKLPEEYKNDPKRDEILAKIIKRNCKSKVEWAKSIISKLEEINEEKKSGKDER